MTLVAPPAEPIELSRENNVSVAPADAAAAGAAAHPRASTRYHSLDFWRGLACLMVAVFHASLFLLDAAPAATPGRFESAARMTLERMWYGVPMFFVISGYCITAACLSSRERGRPAVEYFMRRFRRIFPPYWAALALTLALVTVTAALGHRWLFSEGIAPVPPPASLTAGEWATNVTLTEGMRFALNGERGNLMDHFFLTPAWTLAYEEQFYIVCGLALLAPARRFFRTLLAVTGVVAALLIVHEFVRPLPVHGFFFDGRWLIFAAGVAVFYRINVARPATAWRIDLLLLVLLLLTTLVVRQHRSHLAIELRVGLAFALLICLLHRWDRPIAACRWLRPISACGVMCYSLYLVHYPIEKLVSHLLYARGVTGTWGTIGLTIPLSLLPSLLAAVLFHRFVERHFMNAPNVPPVVAAAVEHPAAPLAFTPDETPEPARG